ncbi:hypothetical protein ACIREO_29145 [Streptomyces sp. NPDC102441]|uniref:hypothetical protein n=1 Tax=Streptomyces sp. NPDC102441 TaxID=3366176 RepID=UPI003815D2DF
MDLDSLRFANFTDLDAAITDWEQMVAKLKILQEDAKDDLKAKSDKANWAGENATVTRTFVDKTAGEFADAHTQAETIKKIITDTRGELVGYRTQLNAAIERGLTKNLTVRDTGEGAFTVTMNIHPDRAAKGTTVPEHSQDDVDKFCTEIQHILKNATESDTSAAKVLTLLVDQAKYGFSDASYADRDSAAKAVAEAEKLAKILKKDPHDVTLTELNTLNTTLAAYKNDPLFAERFATQVEPKKILDFYAGVADPYQGMGRDPKFFEQAKQLQKNLGITLGTATISDSDKMQEWEGKMVKLGPGRLGIDDANDPTGFGVMSNLMRFGDYDDQFLNSYGDKLIAYDKERNVEDMSPWVNNWNQGDLNFWDKNDRGRDPMTGFMQALGHNPEASTQFFAQPEGAGATVDKDGEVNEHLKYLTQDRIWLADPTLDGDAKVNAGKDALGYAMESATTGYSYDSDVMTGKEPMIPGSGDRRTAAAAGVMEQVAYLYGSEKGPDMLHEQSELADSLGKMAGAYIDDIDYSLSGIGDHAKDDGAFPAKYDGRANFGNTGAVNFLSVLGQDETSHKAVTTAQHLYTLSALDAYPATSERNIDNAHDALTTGAEARGILDHARVQQAEMDFEKGSEEANKSLGRSGDWIKLGTGVVVGGGIAAVPLPGSTAAALVIAPMVADTAGEAINTFIGHQVDKGIDAAEESPTAQAQLTSQQFYDQGTSQLGQAYVDYTERNPKIGEFVDDANWTQEIEYSYDSGSGQGDRQGRSPHED